MKPSLLFCVAVLAVAACPLGLLGQQTGYQEAKIIGNAAGVGNKTDPQLSNPWGIAFFAGSPFWIADNNSGVSTIYDAQGNTALAAVGIPSATNNSCTPACPTGIVANPTHDFGGGAFLFDTEDGILASWNGSGNATKVVDNSSPDPAGGAVYKGLALVTSSSGNFLLAANFRQAKVDVFDRNFIQTSLAGTFTVPNLPAGFAPHGIHVIGNSVYVAYAMQDAAKHDASPGAAQGLIAQFDLNGTFMKVFTSGGMLNAPWGVVMAPSTFGQFANNVLVGNFGDGAINAFDAGGTFKGKVADSAGTAILNPGLWDMVFGQGGTGDPNTLYLTAGGADQTHGVFAAVTASQAATGASFTFSLSPASVTVMRGGSAQAMVSVSGNGGFNSPVSLSCSGTQAGINCSLSQNSVAPGGNVTVTVSLAQTYGMARLAWPTLSTGVLGFAFVGFARKRLSVFGRRRLWILGVTLATAALLLVIGCAGSSRGMGNSGSPGVTITGASGGVMQSVTLPVSVM